MGPSATPSVWTGACALVPTKTKVNHDDGHKCGMCAILPAPTERFQRQSLQQHHTTTHRDTLQRSRLGARDRGAAALSSGQLMDRESTRVTLRAPLGVTRAGLYGRPTARASDSLRALSRPCATRAATDRPAGRGGPKRGSLRAPWAMAGATPAPCESTARAIATAAAGVTLGPPGSVGAESAYGDVESLFNRRSVARVSGDHAGIHDAASLASRAPEDPIITRVALLGDRASLATRGELASVGAGAGAGAAARGASGNRGAIGRIGTGRCMVACPR